MENLSLVLIVASLLLLQAEAETKKVARLRFYLHDVFGGDKPTVWRVAQCNLSDVLPSGFGKLVVLDNLVTAEPDVNSAVVGRLQGTVGFADLREKALVMLLNLVFTGGEYEGSTLSIVGRNPLDDEVREVPIVGGTGKFRMATGFIITSTYFNDPARVRNVFEYNAVVLHMDPTLLLSTQ
ncbi:hypothetical protein C2S51_026289 [Perilla frutescens var. frutescens]|nr:hypothetical protein C2S51_026289 [Perilla frutescens var. frutescens]